MAKPAAGGVPAWMVTFADLMALMMTFFVLLYSFSSIDEKKYKMIAVSMAKGFGSAMVTASTTPTSVSIGPPSMVRSPMNRSSSIMNPTARPSVASQNAALQQQLTSSMQKEIDKGMVAVETSGNAVVIRFPEKIAFPPGSDELSDEIMPILKEVSKALEESPGTIMVSGHTDDRPISSKEFRSNWELSTDRAVSVIELLQKLGDIPPERLTAVGYGSTRPLAPNDTPENRARNRRVEITIIRDEGQ